MASTAVPKDGSGLDRPPGIALGRGLGRARTASPTCGRPWQRGRLARVARRNPLAVQVEGERDIAEPGELLRPLARDRTDAGTFVRDQNAGPAAGGGRVEGQCPFQGRAALLVFNRTNHDVRGGRRHE